MPVMNGYEAASEIRDFYHQNKVTQPMIVACTGHVEEEFIEKAWQHDIDEIMPKPINNEVLNEIFVGIINK